MMVLAGCFGLSPSSGPFTEPEHHPGGTAYVNIENPHHVPVHITITELNENGRGVVLDRTYDRETIVFDGDKDVFRKNGKYQVEIRVNGTIEWDRTIKHYIGYTLRIENNGTVTELGRRTA